MTRTLAGLIVVLALVDGLVHFTLDAFVFHSFIRNMLSELFLLNFVGYLGLIALFFVAQRSSLSFRRVVDMVLIVYPVVTLAAWIYFTKGRGNPLHLADISKPAEVLLAVAALLHLMQLGREETTAVSPARS